MSVSVCWRKNSKSKSEIFKHFVLFPQSSSPKSDSDKEDYLTSRIEEEEDDFLQLLEEDEEEDDEDGKFSFSCRKKSLEKRKERKNISSPDETGPKQFASLQQGNNSKKMSPTTSKV